MSSEIRKFHMPSANLFGSGARYDVGRHLSELGVRKPLLVTDEALHNLGISEKIAKIIRDAGLEVSIYPKVESNPTIENIEAGLVAFNTEKCDSIVTLGGGSSHDAGKGIALVAANGGKIQQYEGIDISKKPMIPLVAINMTAGTGSDLTKFMMIRDGTRNVKMTIVDKHITPTISINDPDLMIGMPSSITAATGLDALTNAIEAYISTATTPITDALAIQAIKIISKYLPRAFANGQDIEAREQMMYAQTLAGMAFNNASLGYVHAIAHQFAGFYNFPQSICNAILLPHVCRFNLLSTIERFADITVALGENIENLSNREAAEKGILAIERMIRDLSIPKGFKELGAKEEEISKLAENAMKDTMVLSNPRKLKVEEVIEIIRCAM